MTSNIHRKILVATVLACAFSVACGGKTKKQESVPAATSGGGEVAAETRPTETTDTGTKPQSPNLQDVIYFEFDQSELDADAKRKLEENAAWLKENPARTLTIEGHTDEAGTPEYNLGLGERRARSSRDYLINLGADAAKVSIITYGEERPAGQEDSQNRRSVFIATKK